MTLSDVLEISTAYLSENISDADNGDFKSRAALMLPSVITALLPLDRAFLSQPDKTYVPLTGTLTEEFPLCGQLAPLCAIKLAYLLAADENTVLYSVLKSEYEDMKDCFIESLPSVCGSIKNVY